MIGVTVNHGSEAEEVTLFVNKKHAPYVLTKPFHPSQRLIDENEYGITISLMVQHNFELEKEILGMGDGIAVLSPDHLRTNITEKLNNALDLYKTLINGAEIVSMGRKYTQNGFCTVNQLYSRKSINQLGLILSKSSSRSESGVIDLETEQSAKSILRIPSVDKILTQLVGPYFAKYANVPVSFVV